MIVGRCGEFCIGKTEQVNQNINWGSCCLNGILGLTIDHATRRVLGWERHHRLVGAERCERCRIQIQTRSFGDIYRPVCWELSRRRKHPAVVSSTNIASKHICGTFPNVLVGMSTSPTSGRTTRDGSILSLEVCESRIPGSKTQP